MIQDIVKKGFCTQCGVCVGICPENCIDMKTDKFGEYVPDVTDKCTQCGLCLKVCPGKVVNFPELNQEIFGNLPEDKHLGCLKKCYLGYSKDEEIRKQSSSGGIVTTLAVELLKQKKVDGVIVATDTDDPLHPKPIIARNKEDLLGAMQSKYVTIPMGTIIRSIMKENGKFAFVGVPCHIHGIRKAEEAMPELKKKIRCKIGLFCEYTPRRDYLNLFARLSKVKLADTKSIKYREGMWPGNLLFKTNQDTKEFPIKDYLYFPLSLPYINKRCLKCIDHTNELADVSVGDAWGLGKSGVEGGWAEIIVRGDIKIPKSIFLEEIESEQIKSSQHKQIALKKEGFNHRMKKCIDLPEYGVSFGEASDETKADCQALNILISLRRIGIYQKMPTWFYMRLLKRIFRDIKLTV